MNNISTTYFKTTPQLWKLMDEIGQKFSKLLKTEDIAVYIKATHLCVASRGAKDEKSVTKTNFLGGKFEKNKIQNRFINALSK